MMAMAPEKSAQDPAPSGDEEDEENEVPTMPPPPLPNGPIIELVVVNPKLDPRAE